MEVEQNSNKSALTHLKLLPQQLYTKNNVIFANISEYSNEKSEIYINSVKSLINNYPTDGQLNFNYKRNSDNHLLDLLLSVKFIIIYLNTINKNNINNNKLHTYMIADINRFEKIFDMINQILKSETTEQKTDNIYEQITFDDELTSKIISDITTAESSNLLNSTIDKNIDITKVRKTLSINSYVNYQVIEQLKENLHAIEQDIDYWNNDMPRLLNFVAPSHDPFTAYLNVVRTICRRAERKYVLFLKITENLINEQNNQQINTRQKYQEFQIHGKILNRLSSAVFAFMRYYEYNYRRPACIFRAEQSSWKIIFILKKIISKCRIL